MICPLMSKLSTEPPIKIECGINCAWHMTVGGCAITELAEKTDAFEITATLQEIKEAIDIIGSEVVKKL